jgi:uncharacterized phage-associated protein
METKPRTVIHPAVEGGVLARAIIARQPRVSGVRLVKLAFLAEVRYSERFGRRLSNADWFNWKHGPYSKRIINDTNAQPADVVRHEQENVLDKMANFYYPGPNCAPPLPGEVSSVLDDLIAVYGEADTQSIVTAAYRSTPFARSTAGRKIDLDGWAAAMNDLKESPEVHSKIKSALESQSHAFSTASELLELLNDLRQSGGA